MIETYLPKAAAEADIVAGVKAAIAEMGAPTMKEMGTVMKNAMARFSAAGMRVDGKDGQRDGEEGAGREVGTFQLLASQLLAPDSLRFCAIIVRAMDLFISWSGARSGAAAEALRDWLPKVVNEIKPWLSSADIDKGARWSSDIAVRLQSARAGIICLTPGNLRSEWILFEAGALSRSFKKRLSARF